MWQLGIKIRCSWLMTMVMANEHNFPLFIISRDISIFVNFTLLYVFILPSAAYSLLINRAAPNIFVKLSFHCRLMHSVVLCLYFSLTLFFFSPAMCWVWCNQPWRQTNTSFGFEIPSFCNTLSHNTVSRAILISRMSQISTRKIFHHQHKKISAIGIFRRIFTNTKMVERREEKKTTE